MNKWYADDLAYIHDAGFGGHALNSAPGLLGILDQAKMKGGLVVDLGCGSGLWADRLIRANYRVLGIDISGPMIAIARRRVPRAEFRIGSLFSAAIPRCSAVTSIGECLNYMFDSTGGLKALGALFRRVHQALEPGGLFVFDIAEPGQVAAGTTTRGFTEGKGWLVLVEKEEDPERSILTRRIITFRKTEKAYQRVEEIHRQRLYRVPDIAAELRRTGFKVRPVRRYGSYALPKAHAAFIARRVE